MSGAKILVVDDEPQIRRMMRATLTGSGHQVDEARTGEEALEKFRAFLPDLVLLDLNLPGMDGLENMPGTAQRVGCPDHYSDGA